MNLYYSLKYVQIRKTLNWNEFTSQQIVQQGQRCFKFVCTLNIVQICFLLLMWEMIVLNKMLHRVRVNAVLSQLFVWFPNKI